MLVANCFMSLDRAMDLVSMFLKMHTKPHPSNIQPDNPLLALVSHCFIATLKLKVIKGRQKLLKISE